MSEARSPNSRNIKKTIHADICVLGAGSAGLSVAAGAAQMGAKTVLIERHRMGGDCLNTGCVPSKSLISAGHAIHAVEQSSDFGISAQVDHIDFAKVHEHIHGVIADIAPHDSVERFEGLGCIVLQGQGHFINTNMVVVDDTTVIARRYVIATGSRPALPEIPGLDGIAYHTNETIFDIQKCPKHLIVLGGGPIGTELAQAFRRLGATVTQIVRSRLMPKEDLDAVAVVRQAMERDGITVHEGVKIGKIEKTNIGLSVHLENGDVISGSHLLVATGRQPNIEGLDLDVAGVIFTDKGIIVDPRLRTSNRYIFAAGDVTGGPQFTHWAGYHAGIIIRNALFRLPAKVDDRALPRVTYSDPELAQVGMTEREAQQEYGPNLRVLTSSFSNNDRARSERNIEGFAKIMVTQKGKVVGATIVGKNAGDLIQTWCLAISAGIKISSIAGMIAPYPTRGEINKRVAGSFFTPKLYSDKVRWLVKFLGRFG